MGTSEVSLMLNGQRFITPPPPQKASKQTSRGTYFFRATSAPSCDFHHSHQHSPKFEELIYIESIIFLVPPQQLNYLTRNLVIDIKTTGFVRHFKKRHFK